MPFLYIFWFQLLELKKSSKLNCAISLHQNLSPTAINWKAGWCLQESLSDQSTPSMLRHACFLKSLSLYLPISSESNAGQQQMKGRHLANTPNCYESSLPSFLPSSVLAAALLQASLLTSQKFGCQQVKGNCAISGWDSPMLDILHPFSYGAQGQLVA